MSKCRNAQFCINICLNGLSLHSKSSNNSYWQVGASQWVTRLLRLACLFYADFTQHPNLQPDTSSDQFNNFHKSMQC